MKLTTTTRTRTRRASWTEGIVSWMKNRGESRSKPRRHAGRISWVANESKLFVKGRGRCSPALHVEGLSSYGETLCSLFASAV